MATEIIEPDRVILSKGSESVYMRSEIDTSAPIESVKEAANRFGGMAFWKPIFVTNNPSLLNSSHLLLLQSNEEKVDIVNLEKQAAKLEIDLITKEKETFNVLTELETTKNIVEELKLMLQKEADTALQESSHCLSHVPEEENNESKMIYQKNGIDDLDILLELKRAKLNLTRTTSDIADIRATVDLYNKKIVKEKVSLEKTRQRLSSSTSKISCLEEELNQSRQNIDLVKGLEGEELLQKLSSETEQFKKLGEAAKSEVLRTISEIELTKTNIRTAEIRLVAAGKIKEAAKASESLALAEIKALSNSEKTVTLTIEEYSALVKNAQEAEEASKSRVANTMVQVDESIVSKNEIMKRLEIATEEVEITKKTLEEAMSRVEAANKGKLEVEEALRKWRSEHGQKRRSLHTDTDTKFKNSYSTIHRKDEVKLKPCLSIGQILNRKLFLDEEVDDETRVEKRLGESKVSLRQMLGKFNGDVKRSGKDSNNEVPVKKKKYGFGRISRLVTKQSKKKKKNKLRGNLMCRGD